MNAKMFERFYGEIRKMGRGAIEREKPLENPISGAESLFYRGLIYEAFDPKDGAVVYVPMNLAEVLPLHKTTYDDLPADPVTSQTPQIEEVDPDLIEEPHPADTAIVDDMTALLAYLRIHGGTVVNETLDENAQAALNEQFIHQDPRRLTFIFQLSVSANLAEVREGNAFPRIEAKPWLEKPRSEQLRMLALAWRESKVYRDLWHVEGLFPEPTGWPYDPAGARQAVIAFMHAHVPAQGWWGIDDFIIALKAINPDFQRPNGDYESWYIRNREGDYLHGFESWDAVEGALLEYYFLGPMHWLGLVDLAEDAVRLTAYGRAFVAGANWPKPPEPDEPITVENDGTLLASRKVSRFERFQMMRFTTWAQTEGEVYRYRLTGESIQQAAAQGITTAHIAAFLKRYADPLPSPVAGLLEAWQAGPSNQVTMEELVVLRTTSPEALDYINEKPALRRFLGAKLGPMAVVVRDPEGLRAALDAEGIEIT